MSKKIQSPEDLAEFLHKASVAESLLREILRGSLMPERWDDGDYILILRGQTNLTGAIITSEEARLVRELIGEGKK